MPPPIAHAAWLKAPETRALIAALDAARPGASRFIGACVRNFSKKFMVANNIPTASYDTFDKENLADGLRFLETRTPPFVLKVDGLAAGKGVVILNDLQQAKTELNDILAGTKFGKAGTKVVIEEFLEGIELSVFVLTVR